MWQSRTLSRVLPALPDRWRWPRPALAVARPFAARHRHTLPDIEQVQDRLFITRDQPVPGSAPAFEIDIYRPAGHAEALPALIWWHGGGFVAGTKAAACCLASGIADATRWVVISADYALSPEAAYPTAVLQGHALLQYVASNAAALGVDPGRIVVGGDSAGSGLAAQLVGIQTNPELAGRMGVAPAAVDLIGAALYCGPSNMDTLAATGFPLLGIFLPAYTGRRDWQSLPRLDELSAVRWVSPAWPPTLLTGGDADPMTAQVVELRDRLSANGVALVTDIHEGTGEGLSHEYELRYDTVAGRHVLDLTASFLRARLLEPQMLEPQTQKS